MVDGGDEQVAGGVCIVSMSPSLLICACPRSQDTQITLLTLITVHQILINHCHSTWVIIIDRTGPMVASISTNFNDAVNIHSWPQHCSLWSSPCNTFQLPLLLVTQLMTSDQDIRHDEEQVSKTWGLRLISPSEVLQKSYRNPSEVFQKSFRSPPEVLQKSFRSPSV